MITSSPRPIPASFNRCSGAPSLRLAKPEPETQAAEEPLLSEPSTLPPLAMLPLAETMLDSLLQHPQDAPPGRGESDQHPPPADDAPGLSHPRQGAARRPRECRNPLPCHPLRHAGCRRAPPAAAQGTGPRRRAPHAGRLGQPDRQARHPSGPPQATAKARDHRRSDRPVQRPVLSATSSPPSSSAPAPCASP